MAKQGFTYSEILSFYYPGTEIRKNYGEKKEAEKMSSKAEKVASYARSKAGCGYVYGASGQMCTEAFINKQAE